MDKATKVIETMTMQRLTLATAESCTGGLLGARITDVPDASRVYLGGIVSYAYAIKHALLGVNATLLESKGAVCAEVAGQMAQGALRAVGADYALAVTGNAGPGTDEKNTRLGECFVACADAKRCCVRRLELSGSRAENREACCSAALELLAEMLNL